ncbi:MAG TPA: cytochrome c3 family protein [Ignavibacteria bacterium]|nr:cytochrome c3 family protein [Ignavibacteria bacterium]
MNLKKFYIVFLGCALLFVTLTAYVSKNKSLTGVFGKSELLNGADNKDVVKFNHSLHIKDASLACKDCHKGVYESVKGTDNLMPAKKDCAACHDVNDQKNCNFCHYSSTFKRFTRTDRELIFAHKNHLTQNIDCNVCHSGIQNVKYSSEAPNGGFPKMETCYGCHDGKKQVNSCEACHTNLTNLKPSDHLNKNFLNEHKVIYDATSGNTSSNCMMCHSNYFCEACHQPVKYQGDNANGKFYAPYYSKDFATRTDRTALQKLTTVHDLNYQFTHGLDAKQKSFECKTCHDPVSFCSSCHQDKGNLQSGFMPNNHLLPNFKTFGVNTGGGLHAVLAKRDIESCESCHSVNGADPTCVMCHFDNDGIKGTNPKTHESGFMSDENGNWHKTKGSLCYTCHTDANARPDGVAGVGFCGYCHGTNTK